MFSASSIDTNSALGPCACTCVSNFGKGLRFSCANVILFTSSFFTECFDGEVVPIDVNVKAHSAPDAFFRTSLRLAENGGLSSRVDMNSLYWAGADRSIGRFASFLYEAYYGDLCLLESFWIIHALGCVLDTE